MFALNLEHDNIPVAQDEFDLEFMLQHLRNIYNNWRPKYLLYHDRTFKHWL